MKHLIILHVLEEITLYLLKIGNLLTLILAIANQA